VERAGALEGAFHIEPQGIRCAGFDPPPPLGGGEVPAGARIDRIGAMRGRGGARDIGAGAETGIEQPGLVEPAERVAIIGEMLGLAAHIAVPVDAEPAQIVGDGGDELRAAARAVDILDPQPEFAARVARLAPREQRRISVAEMEPPGRARREPRNDQLSAASAISAWYVSSGRRPLS